MDHRNSLAGIAQPKGTEFDGRVGSQPQRTTVFELDFGAAAVVRPHLRPLRYWEVEEGVLKAQTRVLVDLNGTLNVGEANDASSRIGQRRVIRAQAATATTMMLNRDRESLDIATPGRRFLAY